MTPKTKDRLMLTGMVIVPACILAVPLVRQVIDPTAYIQPIDAICFAAAIGISLVSWIIAEWTA